MLFLAKLYIAALNEPCAALLKGGVEFLDKRRAIMQSWANYCSGEKADKVVRLRG